MIVSLSISWISVDLDMFQDMDTLHQDKPQSRHAMFHDMFHDMFVFTICSFNSPDLDGHRAPKMKYCPTETHKRSLNPNTKPPHYVRIKVLVRTVSRDKMMMMTKR